MTTAVAPEIDLDVEESWSSTAREATEATMIRTPRRRWLAERAMDANTRILDINEDSEPTEDASLPTIEPMVEYQNEPLKFFTEKLGIPANTICWSSNLGYETHTWDGDRDPLVKLLDALVASNDVCVEAATGTQKAQPVDEPVLTPNGWRAIGDLRAGDLVIGVDGQPTRVTGTKRQGTRPVYRITFSDGASTRACGEHLWNTRNKSDTHRGRPWKTLNTEQIARLLDTHPESSWRIPIAEPPALPHRTDLPLDPYLVGVILGDGCVTQRATTFSSADQEIVEAVGQALPPGVRLRPNGKYTYRIATPMIGGRTNPVTVALRSLGIHGKRSENKRVPSCYLLSAPEQRLAILQGLMDTDGFVDPRGIVGFCSTSHGLADDVVDLVRSLGGTARRRIAESWMGETRHRDASWVSVRLPSHLNPFRLGRKASRVNVQREPARIFRTIELDGEVECVCISIEASHRLYVTRDYVVTHNSYTAAAVILWFLASWKEARVFTFAPKEEQLRAYIWMEIGKLWPRFKILFPTAEITDLRIQMRGRGDKAWGAQGFSVGKKAGEEVSTKAQGQHAEHMLLVYEEAPGIDLAVMEAGENTSTAPHNLRMALGNPDHQLDALHLFGYDQLGNPRPGVVSVRISALDHPNVVLNNPSIVPGAASVKSVDRRRVRYTSEGRLFKSRVRGMSPAEAAEALIKLEWVQRAQRRWADLETRAILLQVGKGKKSRGVDVANSTEGDDGAVARGQGAVLFEVEAKPCPNANLLGHQIHKEMEEDRIEDAHVGVDGVGVGAGAINELLRLGRNVRSLLGGDKAEGSVDEEQWNNLRSQMWWTLREDLRRNDSLGPALPPDVELSRDLITPTYKTVGSKIVIESKEDIKKRTPGGRSPNKGDATVYWNFVRPRDPVKTEMPKRAPTIQERILAELKALDNPSPKKHYDTVLRQ